MTIIIPILKMGKLSCRINFSAACSNTTHILSLRLNAITHKAFPTILKWNNENNEVKEEDRKEQEEKTILITTAKLSA